MDWNWNKRRERAALLVAQDELTNQQIADELKVTRQCLDRWKRQPEFQARVQELLQKIRDAILREGIADKAKRVKRLNDLWDRMYKLLDARAQEYATLPGGTTGLVVLEERELPGGVIVRKHSFDAAVLKEIREYMKQAAQEIGEWKEGNSDALLKHIDLTKLSTEQLERLANGDDPIKVLLGH